MKHSQLLEAIQRAHASFLATINEISTEIIVSEKVVGEWTIKDMLGHMAMWMDIANKFIMEYKLDGMPKSLGLKDDAAVDAYNAQGWHARRDMPLPRVCEEFDAAYGELIAAVEKLSEEQLNAQLPEPWEQGVTLERLIAVNSYEHEPEHTEQVKVWQEKQSRNK